MDYKKLLCSVILLGSLGTSTLAAYADETVDSTDVKESSVFTESSSSSERLRDTAPQETDAKTTSSTMETTSSEQVTTSNEAVDEEEYDSQGNLQFHHPVRFEDFTLEPPAFRSARSTISTQQAFINQIAPSAKTLASANDLYASVMIAQAIVESGWGSSTLSKAPNYNLFGIKGTYNGQYVIMKTQEWSASQGWYWIDAKFRKYPSYKESLGDNATVLKTTSFSPGNYYYSGAWKSNTKSYKDATAWLTGRYATAPNYATTLNSIIQTYNLTQYDTSEPNVSSPVTYSSHVNEKGWLNAVSNNSISGTVGEGRRVEAIKMSLASNLSGNIEYQTHIQGIGWESTWKKNGQISGTTGSAKRVEALKIKLSGDVASKYDVYYRVHSQNFGWMNWAKNGEAAGTEGFAYRVEAFQVQLVPKGKSAPVGEGRKFAKFQDVNVSYQSHVQNKNWMTPVYDSKVSGTVGNNLRIEAVRIGIVNNPLAFSGTLEYQTHSANIGWQNWKNNYNIAGTVGQRLRVEAIKIRLTGDLSKHYDVYYRVHCQTYGWLGWTKNGQMAGTTGKAKQMEAIQVKIVRKNTAAPK